MILSVGCNSSNPPSPDASSALPDLPAVTDLAEDPRETEVSEDVSSTACDAGMTACGTRCVHTQTDTFNCGECGRVCLPGQVCGRGVCAVSCSLLWSDCAGGCVDLQSDRFNCGRCGFACASDQVCSAGGCQATCGARLTNCAGTCLDLTHDRLNCGACGRVCCAGNVCSGGICQVGCLMGQAACPPLGDAGDGGCAGGGSCRDLNVSPIDCGACGRVCPGAPHAEGVCAARACRLRCLEGFGDCDGDPVNGCESALANAATSCGACGVTCASGQRCDRGRCVD